MDTNRNFRHRHKTPVNGGRVTKQPTDLAIVEATHRFGDQTVQALFQILYPLYSNYHAFQVRVAQLRQLENTEYDGPLLHAPSQQTRGASRPDSNHLVVGDTIYGERLLKRAGLWREHHPKTKNKEWKHDFMRNTILSSVFIASKGSCEFIYHDEVLADLYDKLPFAVPDYTYEREKGGNGTRSGAKLSPDGFFALRYQGGTKRIFLIEADCDTEPDRSDNLERKSRKHNILSYDALFSDGDMRRKLFRDARVGVLNVFSVERAMRTAMEVHEKEIGSKGSYMLYASWEAFGDYFRPPPPRPDLFTDPWHRVGQPPAYISQATAAEPQSVLSPLQPANLRIRVSARR
jgi:hypothetical protein